MTKEIVTAIFTQDFNYTSTKTNAGWAIKAGSKAKSFPREVIAAAIAAGVASLLPERTK
jgi:hypothetical protein